MANTTKITLITLENQRLYDGLIKKYIGTQISNATKSSLKSVSINGNTLKFYTEAKPSTESVAAFTIELPETDLSDFMHLIKNATAGDVIIANANGSVADGGVKLADLAKSADVTKEIGDAKLVDIYSVKANATQIQLAIDSSTREISATIVAGSVGTAELADGAVVTAKIADGNVTKAKLAKTVQDSLNKADSALQEADVATLRTDVAANKASLAEGGATANAIKANKEAAAKAQGDVNALATRVKNLESVEYVEATEAEIKAMFPTA